MKKVSRVCASVANFNVDVEVIFTRFHFALRKVVLFSIYLQTILSACISHLRNHHRQSLAATPIAITPGDSSQSLSPLPHSLKARRGSRVPEIESPRRDIRTVGLPRPPQKLHINESEREEEPRPYRHTFSSLSSLSSLSLLPLFAVTFFSLVHISRHYNRQPILSEATSSFPLNFPCPVPLPLHPLSIRAISR